MCRQNQKRPEDAQVQPLQYEDEDYEDAQEYSQPQHNYAKRLSILLNFHQPSYKTCMETGSFANLRSSSGLVT